MHPLKQRIIDQIIFVEGGFADDPDDSGGATNYGITEAVARAYGYQGNMRDMPRSIAFDIYVARYWDKVHADDLIKFSEHVAEEIVDTAVNMGPSVAVTFLQRSLNVLNDRGRLYEDLTIDGIIGGRTLEALGAYISVRSELVLCRALNCLQGARYIELAEKRKKDERYLFGWLQNRVIV